MQKTIEEPLVELAPKDVTVYSYDGRATHDYSCPICRKHHAILDLSCGVMRPCSSCASDGYYVLTPAELKKHNVRLYDMGVNGGVKTATVLLTLFFVYVSWLFYW